MYSNITRCFWGVQDQEAFVSQLEGVLGEHIHRGAYAGDNLIVFGRNLSFLQDSNFMNAFTDVIHPSNYVGYGIMWRVYTFCWAAMTSLRVDGALVECGVSTGTSSSVLCRYGRGSKLEQRPLVLYDAWGEDDRVDSTHYGFSEGTYNEVIARFKPFPNVHLVKGFVPDSFSTFSPEKIAFLHIDLNNADAEIATLEALFDKVSPGGLVLFDDFGATGFKASHDREIEWLKSRGYDILELPTGQGLVIK